MTVPNDVEPVFKKWSGGDDSMDAKDLVLCLNQLLIVGKHFINMSNKCFYVS